jgi:hypothetical protein
MLGCSTCSVPSPTGHDAPDRPCLRGQPVTPAMAEAGPKEGPKPGATRRRHSRSPCPPLEAAWGAAERGRGSQAPAPSLMPFASARRNTGDVVREVKARGQEAREPPTQRQGPPDESEGAEESAAGPAVHTGHPPHGAGPSPLAVWRTQGGGVPSPQRPRTLGTSPTLVPVGAMGCNTEALLWMPSQWKQMLQSVCSGDRPEVLRRVR